MTEVTVYEMSYSWKKITTRIQDHDVKDAKSIKNYLRGIFDDRPEQEHLVVIHVDAQGHIKGREIVFLGNLVSCTASYREIFRGAVAAGSFGIILAHNHPGGDLTPSEADIMTTKNIIAAGKILGIPVFEQYICDSDLSETPIKMSNLHPALWALKPSFVPDTGICGEGGILSSTKDLDKRFTFGGTSEETSGVASEESSEDEDLFDDFRRD